MEADMRSTRGVLDGHPPLPGWCEEGSKLRAEIGEELPHLRRYALSLTRCPAEADDLVQSCIERALAREAQFDQERRLRPWLFRILHNLHVSNVRRRKREYEQLRKQSDNDGVAGNQQEYCDLDAAGKMLAKLPSDYREVLLIVCVSGLSYQEAAAVLEVPVGTVRSRIFRAREQLRQQLS